MNKYLFLFATCFWCFLGHSTPQDGIKDWIPKYSVRKYGTLIGIQRGKFFTIEAGIEQQFKKLQLKKPTTWAWNAHLDYAWQPNTLSFKAGSWYKDGRAGFTLGGSAVGASDFEHFSAGVSPEVGIKLFGFHVLASYNVFLINPKAVETNNLHLSIRYFISRNRDIKRTNKPSSSSKKSERKK